MSRKYRLPKGGLIFEFREKAFQKVEKLLTAIQGFDTKLNVRREIRARVKGDQNINKQDSVKIAILLPTTNRTEESIFTT